MILQLFGALLALLLQVALIAWLRSQFEEPDVTPDDKKVPSDAMTGTEPVQSPLEHQSAISPTLREQAPHSTELPRTVCH
jgi:hypothetical protein